MRKSGVSVVDRPGLDQDQEDNAWSLYEATGSMAAVAEQLKIAVHRVRYVLMKDPIRLAHIRACRAEVTAQKWEERADHAAKLSGRLLDVMDGMLKHIQACQTEGRTHTDMLDFKGKPLTPTAAYQWMLSVRSLDMAQKVGMTGAKISEGLRSLHNHDYPTRHQASNPNQLSDDELRDIVQTLTESGRPVPWGLLHSQAARTVLPSSGKDLTEVFPVAQ